MGLISDVTLDELLAEPITQRVMARDGVTEADVRRVLSRLARAWSPGPSRQAAKRQRA